MEYYIEEDFKDSVVMLQSLYSVNEQKLSDMNNVYSQINSYLKFAQINTDNIFSNVNKNFSILNINYQKHLQILNIVYDTYKTTAQESAVELDGGIDII